LREDRRVREMVERKRRTQREEERGAEKRLEGREG
jgi:hypothetical protein